MCTLSRKFALHSTFVSHTLRTNSLCLSIYSWQFYVHIHIVKKWSKVWEKTRKIQDRQTNSFWNQAFVQFAFFQRGTLFALSLKGGMSSTKFYFSIQPMWTTNVQKNVKDIKTIDTSQSQFTFIWVRLGPQDQRVHPPNRLWCRWWWLSLCMAYVHMYVGM